MGGDDGQMGGMRQLSQGHGKTLVAFGMALQLNVQAAGENIFQAAEQVSCPLTLAQFNHLGR